MSTTDCVSLRTIGALRARKIMFFSVGASGASAAPVWRQTGAAGANRKKHDFAGRRAPMVLKLTQSVVLIGRASAQSLDAIRAL